MSLPLREHLLSIAARVTDAEHLLLGLDFDGTLVPMVDDPSKAILSLESQNALKAIAALPGTSVAIVSERSLQDVRTMVGMDGLIYAGNHGLEICGPVFSFKEPTAIKTQRVLRWLAAALAKGLSQVAGVIVENKTLTISVLCRQVSIKERDMVFRHVQAAAAVTPDCFRIDLGTQVFDVCPQVDWHKGSAMCWIAAQLAKQNVLMLYLGDDRTDEDAFRALGNGITVKVGEPGETSAHYFLDGPGAVREFLLWIANVRMEGGKP